MRPAIVTGLWALCVCAGVVAMVRYQMTPGAAATPPKTYSTKIVAQKGALLVFLHPQCECSRATISELQRVAAQSRSSLAMKIYFYRPYSEPDSWCKDTALWGAAKNIDGASLIIDIDAKVAKSYGARCSGQVLLYSASNRKLEFSGGITASRGHEGQSQGEDAILEYAQVGRCSTHSTPVYGCAIWSDLDVDRTNLIQKGVN